MTKKIFEWQKKFKDYKKEKKMAAEHPARQYN